MEKWNRNVALSVLLTCLFRFFPFLSGMASGPQKKERLSTLWCIALATSKPGPLQVNKSTLIHIILQLRVPVSETWWWPLLRLQSSCISASTEFKQFLGVLWQKTFFFSCQVHVQIQSKGNITSSQVFDSWSGVVLCLLADGFPSGQLGVYNKNKLACLSLLFSLPL